jgi:hypothetical protein
MFFNWNTLTGYKLQVFIFYLDFKLFKPPGQTGLKAQIPWLPTFFVEGIRSSSCSCLVSIWFKQIIKNILFIKYPTNAVGEKRKGDHIYPNERKSIISKILQKEKKRRFLVEYLTNPIFFIKKDSQRCRNSHLNPFIYSCPFTNFVWEILCFKISNILIRSPLDWRIWSSYRTLKIWKIKTQLRQRNLWRFD